MSQIIELKDGYKPSPLGLIPIDWEIEEFGCFAELEKNKYNPIGNKNVRCLELEHFEQSSGNILGWVDSLEQKSIKNKFIKGQVLFGKLRPYLRKYWLAEFDGICSTEVWVLKSKGSKCLNEYLFYFIQSNHFIQVANVSSGSKMPRADWDYVSSFPFPLPTISEQKSTINVLKLIDKSIKAISQLIKKKQLQKKALLQQLLTGKKRLNGFDKEWKRFNYSEVLKVVKRSTEWDDEKIYNLISVRRRSGGIFMREALLGHKILVKNLRLAKEGDFLFSKMQILHGASAIVTKEFNDTYISGSYIAVIAKNEQLLSMEYFNWYSQLPYFYHQTYISSYGVHIEKMTFDFETFLSLDITLPIVEEQKAINDVLNAAENEIQLLKSKADKLKEQKKGMMQLLLTGRKRLKIN